MVRMRLFPGNGSTLSEGLHLPSHGIDLDLPTSVHASEIRLPTDTPLRTFRSWRPFDRECLSTASVHFHPPLRYSR